MYKTAKEPNDLEQFFVERANSGDVDGLVALYEQNAVLVSDDGKQVAGTDRMREFFGQYLQGRPQLAPSVQAPALCIGNLALTSSRHSDGAVSAEIARRQPDGTWLWVVDRFAVGKDN